jgi:NitT/TauT family transport system substrate-binding protein
MRITRRLVGAVAACVVLAALATGCAGADGPGTPDGVQPVDVAFGYIPDFNGTSLLAIAKDQGLWEKHGVNVTTTSFTNGPLQIQALGTGDLDFGYIGPGAIWLPASGQAKIIAVNTLGRADRVVAQPGITSIEDLRGRTVAVPEGTSGDMILTLALQKAGMTKADVKLVAMEPAAIITALSSKQVDAAGIWYPALATVKQRIPDLVELATNQDFEETVAFPTAFVAGNDVVAHEPEKVARVLKVLREAIAFRAANPEQAVQLTADFSALDPAQVQADADNVQVLSLDELDRLTEDGTIDKWFAGLGDYFVGAGKLQARVDPAQYYTGDLFLRASE